VTNLRRIPALAILAGGWLGFMVYAFPGYMSFDSVFQLQEARSGVFSDGHPPVMAALWQLVDCVIAGPIGMLVIQSSCFLVGVYLVFRTRLSARASAVAATLVLWFPITATTMAVIWKDAQMAGYLALGAGLLLSPRRWGRVAGLGMIWLATAMRWNALAMTLPLVVLLFVWDPLARWWKRYAVSVAGWLAITISVQLVSSALVTKKSHLWSASMALLDIVGTLRYSPNLSDAEVTRLLDGAPVTLSHDLQAATQGPIEDWNFAIELWKVTNEFFRAPSTDAERAALVRAWRTTVLSHPAAYLEYRAMVFAQVLQLPEVPEEVRTSAVYEWFTDIQDPLGSAKLIDHNASASWLQEKLRGAMWWFGTTRLFQAYIFFLLSIALLPFCFGDRPAFAVLASGLVGEAGLFIVAPTSDWRYSFWLVVATVLGTIMLVARRAGERA
jgi:hypothetical protein